MITKIIKENIVFFIILTASICTTLIVALSNPATFDSGDGIQHYLMARYSWQHPHLLLDLWGKPLFTLFSSPFAQFGLKGMYVFNILCATVTSVLCYEIAKKLQFSYAWSVPVFIFFSPIYFGVINSGLTELFFSTVLIFSIWLSFQRKYNYAAIVASLLPYARPEGYLFILLFGLYLIINRKFFVIPLLGIGTLLLSMIGYFYYNDAFWIISNNYSLETDAYTHRNPVYHYLVHYNEIWGTAYFTLIIIGLGAFFYTFFKKHQTNYFFREELFLIIGAFFSILLLHSIMTSVSWMHNNLGMMRFMAALIPSSSIIALRGINAVAEVLSKMLNRFNYVVYVQYVIVFTLLYFIVNTPFRQWYYPFRSNNEQTVIKSAEKFLKSVTENKKVYYQHPFISVVTLFDPFDTKKTHFWSVDTTKINEIPDSSVFIWDSHFSPLEVGVPLSLLQKNNNFTPLKHFKYFDQKYNFELWVFIKTKRDTLQQAIVPTEIVTD